MLERVPTTVRAMIAARLDGLPPDEKRLLQCASVSGETHVGPPARAARARASTFRGCCAAWSRATSCAGAGVRRPRGSNEFIFKHALIRDVAYGSLPEGENVLISYREVADWLSHDAKWRVNR